MKRYGVAVLICTVLFAVTGCNGVTLNMETTKQQTTDTDLDNMK